MVPEDYVHRIGRTGRAGVDGDAVSLVCVDELRLLRDIEQVLGHAIPSEVIEGFEPDPRIRPEPILRGGLGGMRPAMARPGTGPRHQGAPRRGGAPRPAVGAPVGRGPRQPFRGPNPSMRPAIRRAATGRRTTPRPRRWATRTRSVDSPGRDGQGRGSATPSRSGTVTHRTRVHARHDRPTAVKGILARSADPSARPGLGASCRANDWHVTVAVPATEPRGLAGLGYHREVSPGTPGGSSSVGRAAAFQAACREFEPRLPLHLPPGRS